MKKVVLIIAFFTVLILSYFVWSELENVRSQSGDNLAYVPQNSEMIVSVEDVPQLLIKLEENLAIWDDVKEYADFVSCQSLYTKTISKFDVLASQGVIFSTLKNGEKKDWLMIASGIERDKEQSSVIKKFQEFEYDEYETEGSKLYYFQHNTTQYFSSSMLAIQEAINSVINESFFNYSENKLKVQRLSGSDFYVISHSEKNKEWKESDGFVKRDRVELISSVNSSNNQSLRLWEKLPENYFSDFFTLKIDSLKLNVLSGEIGRVQSEDSEIAIVVGLSKSLKYSLVSESITYDSLNQKRMSLSKFTLKSLLGEAVNLNSMSDSIFGIEDVDFILFSSDIKALNTLYFDLKKNENVDRKIQTEKLSKLSKKKFNESLILEDKLYTSNNGQAIRKVVVRKQGNSIKSIEEYSFKTSFTSNLSQLFTIRNHRTNNFETLVLDANDQLSLVDVNGKVKWTTQLDGKIIDGVSQIDIFKNGKLQILFNTKSKIYLLDILGRNVDNFPINLSGVATNQIVALDYERTKNYRLLIATNKGIFNYDATGKRVSGFKFIRANLNVKGVIRHTVLSGNDYIMFNDEKGKLYFLNRKGEERYQSGVNIQTKDAFSTFRVAGSMSSSSVYTLNDSKVLTEYLLTSEGKSTIKDSTILKKISQTKSGKKYIIGIADRSVNIYTQTGNLVREISCDFEPNSVVSSIKTSQEGKLLILSKTNDLYVFDLYSDSFEDAYHGISSSPLINDFDGDGQQEIVLVQDGKDLYSYPIK